MGALQVESKIGLALGSGGARGLAHIGVLKVFDQAFQFIASQAVVWGHLLARFIVWALLQWIWKKWRRNFNAIIF